MDYILSPSPGINAGLVRVVGARSKNLRLGGGRKDQPGWTDHKLRSSRLRFNALRPYIRTGVTIIYPASASSADLIRMSKSSQNFCKERAIPARAVWEGPGKHQHIALGILHSEILEVAWIKRLKKLWFAAFGNQMPAEAFLWKPDVKPNEIASYLSKTRSGDRVVKKAWPWMTFNPVWEVGFRKIMKKEN